MHIYTTTVCPRYVAVPKTDNKARMWSNIQVFDFSLDESDMKRLDGLDEHYITSWDPTIID